MRFIFTLMYAEEHSHHLDSSFLLKIAAFSCTRTEICASAIDVFKLGHNSALSPIFMFHLHPSLRSGATMINNTSAHTQQHLFNIAGAKLSHKKRETCKGRPTSINYPL